jgi:hypothetical protein
MLVSGIVLRRVYIERLYLYANFMRCAVLFIATFWRLEGRSGAQGGTRFVYLVGRIVKLAFRGDGLSIQNISGIGRIPQQAAMLLLRAVKYIDTEITLNLLWHRAMGWPEK